MADMTLVYIGTYTGGGSEGLYVSRLETGGKLSEPVLAAACDNPSFVALHPNGQYLYAVQSDRTGPDGQPQGAVAAFRIDRSDGRLSPINHQSSAGAHPCHLSVDANGQWLIVANYTSGSVALLPIVEGGAVGEATDAVQHVGGSMVDPKRQAGPHAHMMSFSPQNTHAYAMDLGLDQVLIYRVDTANGKLLAEVPPAPTHGGAGPRHLAWHPTRPYAYVINELDSTMTVYRHDPASGALTEIEHVTTLPADWTGTNYPADVHVSACGRHLYGTNRGHDTLVHYAIDQDTGKLTMLGHEPTQGNFPRSFEIDPSGQVVLVANQNGDNVVSLLRDPDTGAVRPAGHSVVVPKAVCVKYLVV